MKKHFIFFFISILFLGLSQNSFGQNDSVEYIFGERPIMPEFPGGEIALQKFLNENLHYPDSALNYKIQGKVFVGFLVEKDGNISDIKIVGKKTLSFGLEEEAIRVVKLMPKWNPGKTLNGLPTEVKWILPISFKISDEDTTVYDVVDEMPKFADDISLNHYIVKNIRLDSNFHFELYLGTKVIVSFIVSKNGNIRDVKSIKNNANPILTEKVIELLKQTPNWIPGKLKGKNVDVKMILPITFEIE